MFNAGRYRYCVKGRLARGTHMSDFLAAYPDYARTARLDELRAAEYSYLDSGGHVYLDYTGAGLAADAQLRAHTGRLRGGYFGNPHSENPATGWRRACAADPAPGFVPDAGRVGGGFRTRG